MKVNRLVCGLLLLCVVAGGSAVADEREVTLKHQGLTLLGTVSTPAKARDDKAWIVLVHGTLAHKDMNIIKQLTAALGDKGFNTLAVSLSLGVDNRKGMYNCEVPHRHRFGDAGGEIAAWLAYLRGEGAGNIWLLGHSRGGAQVAYALANDKIDVRGAILMAPATDAVAAAAAAWRKQYGAAADKAIEAARAEGGKSDKLIAVPGLLSCQGGQASAQSILSYYDEAPAHETQTSLTKVSLPVLMIAAAKDEVVRDVAEKVGKVAAAQPNIKVETVADADHMFQDLFADSAVDLITDYIDQQKK